MKRFFSDAWQFCWHDYNGMGITFGFILVIVMIIAAWSEEFGHKTRAQPAAVQEATIANP